jgi:hypothetical protein
LTRRVMAEVRAGAPPAVPGRGKKRAAFERLADEHAAKKDRPPT